MRSILIIDHGSQRDEANHMLACVANLLQHVVGSDVIVRHAHMELAEPSIAQGFAECVQAGATEVIGRLADFLMRNETTRIRVEGHTDSTGDDAYNAELSRRRAQAVADALAARSVPASRVEVVGRGEGYPVATNDTSAGRQQNRRVEIVFSDPEGQLSSSSQP